MSEFSNITIIGANLNIDNVSRFFNEELKNVKTELVGLLGPYNEFTSQNSLAKIIKPFENPSVQAVYTDSIICKNIIQYLPSYSVNTMLKNFVINTPLFFRSTLEVKCNEKLKHLYFYDLYRQIASRHFMYHIPEPLVHITKIDNDYIKEIEIIHNDSTS